MKWSLGIIAAVLASAASHAQQPLQHTLPPNTLTAVNLTIHDCGDCGMHCPPGQYCTLDPNTDLARPMFDVDIRNDSDKGVTGGTYRVDVTYADGKVLPGQHSSFDLMTTLGLEGWARPGGLPAGPILPGESYHIHQPIPRLRQDLQIAGVTVVPTGVTYVGGAAQGDDDDLQRLIFDFRQQYAGEVLRWAKDVSDIKTPDQLRELHQRAKTDSDAMKIQKQPDRTRSEVVLTTLTQMTETELQSAAAGRGSEAQLIQFLRAYWSNLNTVCQSESVRK